MTPTPRDVRFLVTATELRDWFDANHATASELWLGYHRKGTNRSDLDWSAAVDEALCVGWIDGVRYRLDETTFAQRFTPRRKGSTWSAINVGKVEALTAEGRMRSAGLAAFAARTPEKTAIYSYERATASFSEAETAALQAVPAAWADWQSRPPSYRKAVTHWVTSAKQPATRERRLATLVEDASAGRKVKPMRVGRDA